MACDALIGTDTDRMRVWTLRRYRPYDPGAGQGASACNSLAIASDRSGSTA